MRTRTKPYVALFEGHPFDGQVFISEYPGTYETMIEDEAPYGHSCYHRKDENFASGKFDEFSNGTFGVLIIGSICQSYPVSPDLGKKISDACSSLNWNKLKSSSKFGIIQLIAELDDSIAIFTKKFWNSISYGSFSWGVLPFVSDVLNILQALKNISEYQAEDSYEDEITISHNQPRGPGVYGEKATVKVRFTGKVKPPNIGKSYKYWLDAFGFHPDLNTAWDLVPLSFAIDWLIPVSKFIMSLKPRGWVDQCTFTGWLTITMQRTVTAQQSNSPGYTIYPLSNTERVFTRSFCIVPLELQAQTFDWDPPSYKNIFDIFYLLILSKKTGL